MSRPLCIAITAMGGQGGGVLADWIVDLAEHAGWTAQSTSVPGVAQRTGATIYYVEIINQPGAILALMPVPGDVDIVIAAELMEAGRAIQRGLVTPNRTTLIASTHRALSMAEKIKPGDGTAPSPPILEAAALAAHRLLAADMQEAAERAGSVISAALFGALAASAALPFPREAFEQTIRRAGLGVEPSLRAFAAGHDSVTAPPPAPVTPATPPQHIAGPDAEQRAYASALARLTDFPEPAREMLTHGLRRTADYQDAAYAHEYLDRVAGFTSDPTLATEAARWIAVAMAYDDPIRVADLKTRPTRTTRLHTEIAATPAQVIETTEFMHPRVDELLATLPAKLGARLERSPLARRLLKTAFERPRRVRTNTLWGFLQLWLVARLRPRRRTLLRHAREMAHIEAWLATVRAHATNPALAAELLACRRLVKGYSDTHSRGTAKFDQVLTALPLIAHRKDAAAWIRRLREAALADEHGTILAGAIATIRTLDPEPAHA
ncbi:MAG: indolepyruvate oxidoreductase subunit beta family protein [Alphaproteobacteria bacterium]|nr:indolepyruvate oxidoreductase subunit beta family protein [Alphaproteobacteria bacterium]